MHALTFNSSLTLHFLSTDPFIIKSERQHSDLNNFSSIKPYWQRNIPISKIYRNNRLHLQLNRCKNPIIISGLRIVIHPEDFLLKKQSTEFHEQYLRKFEVFLHLM